MEGFHLNFDKRIPELERKNRWKTVVDIVWQQWKASPSDLNRLLCAGTQLWYTLLVMDYIRNSPLPPDNLELISDIQLQNNLRDVTCYGLKYFEDNHIFNAYFGYMISVMPQFFLDYNGDYCGWQAKGINMIHRSYALSPNSLFAKAFYYELKGFCKNTLFYDICKEIWSTITPIQWGDSEVQQHFFRVLHGDSFYPDAYS